MVLHRLLVEPQSFSVSLLFFLELLFDVVIQSLGIFSFSISLKLQFVHFLVVEIFVDTQVANQGVGVRNVGASHSGILAFRGLSFILL